MSRIRSQSVTGWPWSKVKLERDRLWEKSKYGTEADRDKKKYDDLIKKNEQLGEMLKEIEAQQRSAEEERWRE